MSYTVKKMAKISGVSVRTLHWYDKIGLLKPAYIGLNGYRYYENEQLFSLLYDILFFKDLGLSLPEIKNLMQQDNKQKIHAMKTRKKSLVADIQLKSNLLVSIDKTLNHFETMHQLDSEFPHDFDTLRQREFEFFLITYNNHTIDDLQKLRQQRSTNISKQELNHLKNTSIRHYSSLTNMIKAQVPSDDQRVQNIIKQHFLMLEKFYNIDLNLFFKMPKFYSKRKHTLELHNFYHARLNHYINSAIYKLCESKAGISVD